MNEHRPRSVARSMVAILCAACFLTMTLGAVSGAYAAEDWPVWPKKTAEPGVEAKPAPPPQPMGATQAGDTAGGQTSKGLSAGTIGWIAAGTVAVVAIAVAAGSGSSGSSSACSQ